MVHDSCMTLPNHKWKLAWPLWGVVQPIEHPVANAGAAARAPPAEPDPHLDICHFGNTLWQFDALILVTQNPIVLLSYFIHHRYTVYFSRPTGIAMKYDFSKAPPAQRLLDARKNFPSWGRSASEVTATAMALFRHAMFVWQHRERNWRMHPLSVISII